MEKVIIKVPQGLNIKSISENQDDAVSVLQTVNAYDEISIERDFSRNIEFYIKNEEIIDNDLNEEINKIIKLFSLIYKVDVKNIIIKIKKNPLRINDDSSNILAGLLLCLNYYYKLKLDLKELVQFSKNINEIVEFYLKCGCKKINKDGSLVHIGFNPYSKYIILESKNYNEDMLLKFKRQLNKYNNYNGDYERGFFYLACKDDVLSYIPIIIKKEIHADSLHYLENARENKVLIKYLK